MITRQWLLRLGRRPHRVLSIFILVFMPSACTARDEASHTGNGPAAVRAAAHSLNVRVSLDPALANKVAPTDTVFVFARSTQGPKMPLAIARIQSKDLPASVTLDDSSTLMPDMGFANFPEIIVGARVSKSGQATPQVGDLEGYSHAFAPATQRQAEVVIAQVVGDHPPLLPVIMPPKPASAGAALGHPKSGAKLVLEIPAEVRAKWKAVELTLTGKGGAPQTVRVPVGGDAAVGGSGLTVRVIALVPAFQSNADAVTSTSNNPDNPAVLVRLLDKDRTLAEGWVFQKYPDFNTFNSDRVQVRLAAALTATK